MHKNIYTTSCAKHCEQNKYGSHLYTPYIPHNDPGITPLPLKHTPRDPRWRTKIQYEGHKVVSYIKKSDSYKKIASYKKIYKNDCPR